MDRLQANRIAENFVQSKIRAIQDQFYDLKEGIASDSKSTAGDKHETGRAMAQLEQEQLSSQLQQLQEHLLSLQQAKRVELENQIGFGSTIQTEKGWFYLSTGLGLIPGDQPFFCLSVQTPMGQALVGKKTGESITLNGQQITILKHD